MEHAPRMLVLVAGLGSALPDLGCGGSARESLGYPPPPETPLGMTYGEWGAAWSQWNFSIPPGTNPSEDETGEHCAIGQPDDTVWFLAGNFGTTSVRACTVPADRALFFPLITSICTDPENDLDPDIPDETEIRDCATAPIDVTTELGLEVDGTRFVVDELFTYRDLSPTFTLHDIPDPNVLAIAPGDHMLCIADGFWMMLRPLESGSHAIHFLSNVPSVPFAIDQTYTLTVE
jgi:hypothetical protein